MDRFFHHGWLDSSGYGTDSEAGSTSVARGLTVVTSLWLQHRHILDWATEDCKARLARRTPPALLRPTREVDSEALAA